MELPAWKAASFFLQDHVVLPIGVQDFGTANNYIIETFVYDHVRRVTSI